MNLTQPVVEQWYRDAAGELFEVVATDEQDRTIEIQFFDGSVTEMDFDSWNEQVFEGSIEAAEPPEDWSGSVDVDSEALERDFEDARPANWASSAAGALRH